MSKGAENKKEDRRGGSPDGKGNRAHEYCDEMARQIEDLAGFGTRQVDIGVVLGISEDTIQKYYSDPFHRGKAKAGIQIQRTLFQQAMGKPKPDDPDKPEEGAANPIDPKNGFEKEPNLGAGIWLRKSQFGDKETNRHEVASGDIHLTVNEPGDADL